MTSSSSSVKLTDQEIKELKKKWGQIDTNGDGIASFEDYLAYKRERKKNKSLATALQSTKKELDKVGSFFRSKTFKEVKFESSAVVLVDESDDEGNVVPVWKEFKYKAAIDGKSIKCYNMRSGAEVPDYDIDFLKMKSEDDIVQTVVKEGKNKFCWTITSLDLVFACSDQTGRERWINLVKQFYKNATRDGGGGKRRMDQSSTKNHLRSSSKRGSEKSLKKTVTNTESKPLKPMDAAIEAELKDLDPFAPGRTEEEKLAIWTRLSEIQAEYGNPNEGEASDSIKTESISSSHSEEEDDQSEDISSDSEDRKWPEAPTKGSPFSNIKKVKKTAKNISKKTQTAGKAVVDKTQKKFDKRKAKRASSKKQTQRNIL